MYANYCPESHHSKRASTDCTNGSHSSANGLAFDITCEMNLVQADFASTTKLAADDVYGCLDVCSTAGVACYGVSFNTKNGMCHV